MAAKVVVVTGASSGIGAQLARVLSARGHHVLMTARREGKLKEVADSCTGPGEALPMVADITQREDHAAVLARALEWKGKVDVWVNNARVGMSRPVLDLSDEDLDNMFRINTKAPLYAMQAVVPYFKAQGRGHVINVSSVLGRLPIASERSAYSACKAALNSLTCNARVDLQNEGFKDVLVTLFSPGPVMTDFGLNAMHGGMDNRAIPNCQAVEEVAEGLADVIDAPRADVYSREMYHKMVAGYYAAERVEEPESRPPFTMLSFKASDIQQTE